MKAELNVKLHDEKAVVRIKGGRKGQLAALFELAEAVAKSNGMPTCDMLAMMAIVQPGSDEPKSVLGTSLRSFWNDVGEEVDA